MAEHAGSRESTVGQITGAIATLFVKYGQIAGEPIPWSTFEAELQAALQEELTAAFVIIWLLTVEDDPGLGLLLPQAAMLGDAAGSSYAAGRSTTLAGLVISSLRDGTSQGRPLAELATPARAGSIAITETTGVIHAAETGAYGLGRRAAGLSGKQEGTWRCEEGACEICSPLDGVSREVWEAEFPDGPPSPHPRCQCWVDWEPLAVAE